MPRTCRSRSSRSARAPQSRSPGHSPPSSTSGSTEAGFGPCTDAALSGATIPIDDTANSPAYPDCGRLAARQGITHTMSIGLPVERRTVGALNVYGTGAGPFEETTAELATAFAPYAAVAVANAGLYATTATPAGNLQRALDSRAVIDRRRSF